MRWAGSATAGFGGASAGGVLGAKVGAAVGTAIGGPVGFVVGGVIGFVGLLIGGAIAGWATKKLGDVMVEAGIEDQLGAQRDLREKLRGHLWVKYRQLNDELFNWLTGLIESTKTAVVRMLEEFISAVGTLTKEGDALASAMHKARHTLAHSSFDALLRAVHPAFKDGRVVLVDATQWLQYRAKLLVQGRDRRPIAGLVIGHDGEMIRAVREHTGNSIDVIEVDGEGLTPRMVASALRPARVLPTAVDIGTTVRVTVSQRESGPVHGRRRRNLLLAEELLNAHIQVRMDNQTDGGMR